MRRFYKRRSTRRGNSSSKRRTAFVRKSFRKGFKPRTSLKRSRYTRTKAAVNYKRYKRTQRPAKNFTKRVIEAVSAPNWYNSSDTAGNLTNTGLCGYTFLEGTYETSHVNNIFASLADSATVNGFTTPYDDRVYIESYTTMYAITNQTNSATNLHMYFYRPRRTVPLAVGGVTTPSMLQLLTAGFADVLSDAAPKPPANDVNITPFQCPAFTTWFKITKVKKLLMQPGQTIRLRLVSPGCTLLAKEIWPTGTGPATCLAYHRSSRLLLKSYGQPVHDVLSPSDASQVTWGIASISCIQTTRVSWRYIPNHESHLVHLDYLPTITAAHANAVTLGYNAVQPPVEA